MKFNKANFGWIFTCFGLFVLLVISIYLGASGWFFKTDFSYTTDLELGKTISSSITKNQANVISLTMDGSFLAGERLPQIVSITNSDDSSSIYLRAKVFVSSSSGVNENVDIVQTVNWTYNESDGYYYFNDLLLPDNKTALCSYVIVNDNFISKNKYIINFVFESLAENEDVQSFWGINPTENV